MPQHVWWQDKNTGAHTRVQVTGARCVWRQFQTPRRGRRVTLNTAPLRVYIHVYMHIYMHNRLGTNNRRLIAGGWPPASPSVPTQGLKLTARVNIKVFSVVLTGVRLGANVGHVGLGFGAGSRRQLLNPVWVNCGKRSRGNHAGRSCFGFLAKPHVQL